MRVVLTGEVALREVERQLRGRGQRQLRLRIDDRTRRHRQRVGRKLVVLVDVLLVLRSARLVVGDLDRAVAGADRCGRSRRKAELAASPGPAGELQREAELEADRLGEVRHLPVVEAFERRLGPIGVVTRRMLIGEVAWRPCLFESLAQRFVARRRKAGRNRVTALAGVDLEGLVDDVAELEVAGRL